MSLALLDLVTPAHEVRERVRSLMPTLDRLTVDTRIARVGVNLAAAFDAYGAKAFSAYGINLWAEGDHTLVTDLDVSLEFADSQVDVMALPHALPVQLVMQCAGRATGECTIWPRLPAPGSPFHMSNRLPSAAHGTTDDEALKGAAMTVHTEGGDASFLGTILDVLVGVRHQLNAEAAAKKGTGANGEAHLSLDIDHSHSYARASLASALPGASASGWRGVLNASVPTADGKPLDMSMSLTADGPDAYTLDGIVMHAGEGYEVLSHLALGKKEQHEEEHGGRQLQSTGLNNDLARHLPQRRLVRLDRHPGRRD